jgi:oxygen-independent coproporphyrinogen-3 oxidase
MHLYVHVPFCLRRCSYCDFAIAVRRRVPAERFVAAILAERDRRAGPEGWAGTAFATVYLGGGTPSRLPPPAVAALLDAFPREPAAEVTLEANPEDVTAGAARAWRAAGVTRVSLGAQSFAPPVLAWMHRPHDTHAIGRALDCLREEGPLQVSVDLMFALPEELEHDVARDLDAAVALEPDHLSAYGLTLEPRTPYARWVARRGATPAPDDRYAAEFLLVHDRLTGAGFDHYEVSNYAATRADGLPRRARHNDAYWTGRPYLGLGPAAHGYAGGRRRWNEREWAAYERAVLRGDDPMAGEEVLTPTQRDLEIAYLGLRSSRGIDPETGTRLNRKAALAAVTAGWLTIEEGWVRPTPRGWLVLDELAAVLTTSPGSG